MVLWNDYEGKTIADAYPLNKLIRPEGRSAFFLTADKDGKPDVIRLTESLNDEHEMLERWRHVSEAHQPNLVLIKTFGETVFDGVRLTYALMEATDANLAEILRERPLTVPETTEVALSIAAALTALHNIDLIHERVEAANVVASGEVVKLRSDCVRECIPDAEFNPPARCQELRQRDIHDLGLLMLQCLTLDRSFVPGTRLPAPFDRIIPHTLDGSFSLAEITRILTPPVVKPLVPLDVLQNVPTHPQAQAKTAPTNGIPRVAPIPEKAAPVAAEVENTSAGEQIPLPLRSQPLPHPQLNVRRIETETEEFSLFRLPKNRWFLVGAAAFVAIFVLWLFSGNRSSKPVATSVAPVITPVTAPVVSATPEPAPVTPTARPEPITNTIVPAGWHVVAYTFNREDQAWTRIAAIKKQHPGLNPRLFTPTGHAPYFVALGGVMSKGEAEAVRKQAVRDGLPRDTFTRNYKAR